MAQQRVDYSPSAASVGIALTLALAAIEAAAGMFGHSKAAMADAISTASAALASVALVFGARSGKQANEADRRPDKAESAAAIGAAVLLAAAGLAAGLSAVWALAAGAQPEAAPSAYALAAIGIVIVAQELLALAAYTAGSKRWRQLLSTGMRPSRAIASVAALAGVSAALLGRALGIPQLYMLDPLAALLIAALVVRTGFRIALGRLHASEERPLGPHDEEELLRTVQPIKGVIAVDFLKAREHGHYVFIDLKISVNPRISVLEGSEIARLVRQQLMKRHQHVADVVIQVTPYESSYPYKHVAHTDQEQPTTLLH